MKLLCTLLFCILANIVIAQPALVFTEYDLNTGASKHSFPIYFHAMGSRFIFTAVSDSTGREIWISDGSHSGTKILKDIWSGPGGSFAGNFTMFNNKIIFSAIDGYNHNNGSDPWITDGLSAGTHIIKDICPVSMSGQTAYIPYNGKLYFTNDDGTNGRELWVTDGTSAGTQMIKDINTGPIGSNSRFLTVFDGKLFFAADQVNVGIELWVSDGTSADTYLLKDIDSIKKGDGNPSYLTVNDNMLYFRACTAAEGCELWVSDGTNLGTRLIKDIYPGSIGSVLSLNSSFNIIAYNNKVYFNATDSSHGNELWVTDGTASGTQLIKDINPGIADCNIVYLGIYNNKMYFSANDGVNGTELWVTDGTTTGTRMVKDLYIGTGKSSMPLNFAVYKNHMYFTALQADEDRQLWVSDGTAAGTYVVAPPMISSINPLPTIGQFFEFNQDSSLYFMANYTSKGCELWSIKDMSGTSVKPGQAPNTFSLYPNPNNGTFTLTLDNNNFTTGSLQVYDVLGRRVHEQAVTDKTQTIRLQQPAGNYWVKLQLDDVVLTKQVVVE